MLPVAHLGLGDGEQLLDGGEDVAVERAQPAAGVVGAAGDPAPDIVQPCRQVGFTFNCAAG